VVRQPYLISGIVKAIDKIKKTVTLQHNAIIGLMPAMTMEFSVSDSFILDNLSVGENVSGKLLVNKDKMIIVGLNHE